MVSRHGQLAAILKYEEWQKMYVEYCALLDFIRDQDQPLKLTTMKRIRKFPNNEYKEKLLEAIMLRTIPPVTP